jgi:hypothetical protein
MPQCINISTVIFLQINKTAMHKPADEAGFLYNECQCRDKGGTEPAGDYTFFYGNGNADHHLGTGFFVHDHFSRKEGRVC